MSDTEARWYCMSAQGLPMLCASKEDAEREAARNDKVWPKGAPHRAVQLCDAAERDRLRDALASKVAAETLLTGMHGKPGEFFIGLQGGAAQILAEGLASQLTDSSAENYIELRFTSRHAAPDEEVVVTIQRVRGKSPHALRREAEAERDRLRAELERIARVANCGSVDSWLALPDEHKRQWFALLADESSRKAAAIREADALRADVRELVERAGRLVEHADFKLGGVLSADSKAAEIPSNAVSMVKARHLASLRDLLAKHKETT